MILASSTLAWTQSISAILRRTNELRLDGVEVWAEHLWRTGENPALIRREAEELGLSLTVHGPSWDLNLCSVDRKMLDASRECTYEAVTLAHQLGAQILVVHPGRHSLNGRFVEYHWDTLLDSYEEIARQADSHGLSIAIEAMEKIPKEFLCEAEAVNRFLRELRDRGPDNVGVTVDLAHLTTVSSEVLSYRRRYEGVIELHLSNVRSNALHTPLADGDLDFAKILPELIDGFEGPIALEGLSDEPNFRLLDSNAKSSLGFVGRE